MLPVPIEFDYYLHQIDLSSYSSYPVHSATFIVDGVENQIDIRLLHEEHVTYVLFPIPDTVQDIYQLLLAGAHYIDSLMLDGGVPKVVQTIGFQALHMENSLLCCIFGAYDEYDSAGELHPVVDLLQAVSNPSEILRNGTDLLPISVILDCVAYDDTSEEIKFILGVYTDADQAQEAESFIVDDTNMDIVVNWTNPVTVVFPIVDDNTLVAASNEVEDSPMPDVPGNPSIVEDDLHIDLEALSILPSDVPIDELRNIYRNRLAQLSHGLFLHDCGTTFFNRIYGSIADLTTNLAAKKIDYKDIRFLNSHTLDKILKVLNPDYDPKLVGIFPGETEDIVTELQKIPSFYNSRVSFDLPLQSVFAKRYEVPSRFLVNKNPTIKKQTCHVVMTRIQLILEILQVTGIAYPIGPIEKPVAFLMPHGPLDSVQVRNLMRSIPEHELCTQAEFNELMLYFLSGWYMRYSQYRTSIERLHSNMIATCQMELNKAMIKPHNVIEQLSEFSWS